MTSPQTVGVIGAGTTGIGIAQACVLAGLEVAMIDVDEQRVVGTTPWRTGSTG